MGSDHRTKVLMAIAAKNEMVEVIGVGVRTREDFNTMSPTQLLGPTPTRGDKASWVRE